MTYTGDSARLLPMTKEHVRALTDGNLFLRDAAVLVAALALEPVCRHCLAVGLPARVAVATESAVYSFNCGHTAGWVKRGRILELPILLHALGWDLRCTRCKTPARAENRATDAAFTVDCSCTSRLMANPLATPHGVPAVDSLGRQESV